MRKIIHTMNIGNYLPRLSAVTIPTIAAYAKKIGAEFNIIKERKFPEWHILYEKFQIYESGKGADLNVFFDADTVVHPDCPDFTTVLHPAQVGCFYGFAIPKEYPRNPYFDRDHRNVALASSLIITSPLTHDLWTPFEEPCEPLYESMKLWHGPGHGPASSGVGIDEYRIAMNLARFNLQYCGLALPETIGKFYHLEATSNDNGELRGLDMALRYMRSNRMI